MRIPGAAIAAIISLAYLAADDDDLLNTAARIVAIAAIVLLALWVAQRRVERRLTQLETRQRREDYWKVYADVMSDLGGIDGETSGDFSTRR